MNKNLTKNTTAFKSCLWLKLDNLSMKLNIIFSSVDTISSEESK